MKLDRLPRQITGFVDRSDPFHSVEGKAFKAACHLVAQMEHGAASSVLLDPLSRSYFGATLQTPKEHISVLCNRVYPFLAFVPPGAFGMDFLRLEFVESSHAHALFMQLTEFKPLDASWLDAPLTAESLADLAPVELKQIGYWKPERVGDVIFNFWD